MNIADPEPRALVSWKRDSVEYRIRRDDLGGLQLVAHGPGRKVRATSLRRAKNAQHATSGWRGISAVEQTRLAELLLHQRRGVLRRLF